MFLHNSISHALKFRITKVPLNRYSRASFGCVENHLIHQTLWRSAKLIRCIRCIPYRPHPIRNPTEPACQAIGGQLHGVELRGLALGEALEIIPAAVGEGPVSGRCGSSGFHHHQATNPPTYSFEHVWKCSTTASDCNRRRAITFRRSLDNRSVGPHSRVCFLWLPKTDSRPLYTD